MTSGPDDNCPVIAGEKTKKINDDGGLGDVYDRRRIIEDPRYTRADLLLRVQISALTSLCAARTRAQSELFQICLHDALAMGSAAWMH